MNDFFDHAVSVLVVSLAFIMLVLLGYLVFTVVRGDYDYLGHEEPCYTLQDLSKAIYNQQYEGTK